MPESSSDPMKPVLWLFIGLAVGIGVGVALGWGVWPVTYTNTEPAVLRADYRDEYIRLVALSYAAEGDLEQARARLARLDAATPTAPLVELTERLIAQQPETRTVITPLARLARDLVVDTPAMRPYLQGTTP